MTFEQFKALLVKRGFVEIDDVVAEAQKIDLNRVLFESPERRKGPNCEHNTTAPRMVLNAYRDHKRLMVGKDVEVVIVGGQHGLWMETKIYSINRDDFPEILGDLENQLDRIWNAFCK